MSTSDKPKSMGLFFIDNQGAYPPGAQLSGDTIFWPDTGKYPTAVPIAILSHPNLKGRICVMAGKLSLIVAVVHNAENANDVQAACTALPKSAAPDAPMQVQQFRIAVDSIAHRVVMNLLDEQDGLQVSDANAYALLTAIAKGSRSEANVLVKALDLMLRGSRGNGVSPEEWDSADSMLSSLQHTIAEADKADALRSKG
jgi:hypothetical protein